MASLLHTVFAGIRDFNGTDLNCVQGIFKRSLDRCKWNDYPTITVAVEIMARYEVIKRNGIFQ